MAPLSACSTGIRDHSATKTRSVKRECGCPVDDGSGPTLYFASFSRVYKMVGSAPVQIGQFSAVCGPASLAVWDDGSGERLFLGGYFNSVSGVAANGVAAWNGEQWSPVGGGVTSSNPTCDRAGVPTLCVFDDGTGEKLYAGGSFDHAGGGPVENIARWDGASWHPVGSGTAVAGTGVSRLKPMTRGGADELWAFGEFQSMGGVPASGLAMWDGTSWSVPIQGISYSRDGFAVNDAIQFPDATSQSYYVGGALLQTTSGIQNAGILRLGCVCADATGDGLVDLQDLAIVLTNFGRTPVPWNLPGNIDQDWNIDLADLSLVLSQFGTTCE
ncbi:MAG: hypothetical protein IT450_00730 [Phycisphaerales bacterium]|nr:hypothetical protein [Phycisphaerales bacterium]